MKGNIRRTSKFLILIFFLNSFFFLHRLLIGAEYLQLRKPIKNTYGGGVKEFLFEEQEFYKSKFINYLIIKIKVLY